MQTCFFKKCVMVTTTVFLILLFSIWSLTRIGIESYTILSGSMEPILRFGDIVLVNTNHRKAGKGDVIAFQSGGNVVVHRVAEMLENGAYITKGDANENEDFQPVEQDAVIGSVCGRLRYSAWIWMMFTTNIRYAVLIAVVVLNVIADRFGAERGGVLVGDD